MTWGGKPKSRTPELLYTINITTMSHVMILEDLVEGHRISYSSCIILGYTHSLLLSAASQMHSLNSLKENNLLPSPRECDSGVSRKLITVIK